MPTVHERFDLARWTAEFPLARAREGARAFVEECARRDPGAYASRAAMEERERSMSPHGDIIVGPASIAHAEQLRAEAGRPETFGPGVPVDVMVWAKGEPRHPAATKVGGIWDSDDEDPACVQHEWWPLGLGSVCGAGDVPAGCSPMEVCSAQLHRTVDYPEVGEDHPIRIHESRGRLCDFEGGKIRGLPYYVQDAEPRPGAFLASIGSISPVGERFPLIGVGVNPDGAFNMRGGFLMFGDCGSLYLFLSRGGLMKKRARPHWAVQGY